MPIKSCIVDGKSGFKFGESGTCYIGKDAKKKALKQAKAMFANGYKGKSIYENITPKFNSFCEKILNEDIIKDK